MASKKPATRAVRKMKLRRGDRVQVLTGKDRGRVGEVVRVLPKTNRVLVEGIHQVKRHQRQVQVRRPGGIIDKELPIPASSVALVTNREGTVRIGYRIDESGRKVRVSRPGGEEV